MKHIIIILLALVAFDAIGDQNVTLKDFKERARASVKADDGKLLYIPRTALVCPSRESAIQTHNYILEKYQGQYTRHTLRRIVDNYCGMSGYNTAGLIIEKVAGSSFIKLQYRNTQTTVIERWFYRPALQTWKEHKANRNLLK